MDHGINLGNPGFLAAIARRAGAKEKTQFDFTGLDSDFFNVGGGTSKGIIISDATHRYGLWAQVNSSGQPDWSGQGVTDYIGISVNDPSSDALVATTFKDTLDGLGFNSAGSVSPIIVVEDAATGDRIDA